jgi:hypothetical protein
MGEGFVGGSFVAAADCISAISILASRFSGVARSA